MGLLDALRAALGALGTVVGVALSVAIVTLALVVGTALFGAMWYVGLALLVANAGVTLPEVTVGLAALAGAPTATPFGVPPLYPLALGRSPPSRWA
jgi:hypothetical protein